MIRYITYFRVSTKEQGRSGLGLAAQERDVQLYLDGFSEVPWEVIGSFTDVESGKNDDRPELAKALALVRKAGATLLISKLDRLSRDVAFIATTIKDPKVRIRVASMPTADTFQLHLYAALAQKEREFIGARTKAALAQAKAQGTKLGGLRDKTAARNVEVQRIAKANADRVAPIIQPMKAQGASLRTIAGALNASGVPTARGGVWTAAQVQRVLDRLGELRT
jgi:DNA invertase Pin-like site-specific DNA recombinase